MIILLILFLILLAVMVLIVWSHMGPVDTSFLEPERLTLIKNYACSLAMCARGCNTPQTKNICFMSKTSDSSVCALSCDDICYSRWPDLYDLGPGAVCGRNYFLNQSLKGNVPLKGCYISLSSAWYTDLTLSIEGDYGTGFWMVGGNTYSALITTEANFPYLYSYPPDGILIGDCNCGENYGPRRTPSWGGATYMTPGAIYDTDDRYYYDYYRGFGDVWLDANQSRELFGCFASPNCIGYTQCLFKGDLYFWAEFYLTGFPGNEGCADVHINGTTIRPGAFYVNVDPTNIRTTLGKEEHYYINIMNDLGTGTSFTIDSNQIPSFCSLTENPVYAEDTETVTTELVCEINENGLDGLGNYDEGYYTELLGTPHKIFIFVTSKAGNIETGTYVTLEVVDFKLTLDEFKPKPVGRGLWANSEVKIESWFSTTEDFDLIVTPDDASVQCFFDTNTLTVPNTTAPEPPYEKATYLYCKSDVSGTYDITVTATHQATGLSHSVTKTLVVEQCVGGIELKTANLLNPGISIDNLINATGFTDCGGRRIKLVAWNPDLVLGFSSDVVKPLTEIDVECIVSTDGNKCTDWNSDDSDVMSGTPGNYEVYAFMDGNGDGDFYNDPGWNTSENPVTITINDVSNPDRRMKWGWITDYKQWNDLLGRKMEMCEEWEVACTEPGVSKCEKCYDPQTCLCKYLSPGGIEIRWGLDPYSNICCKSGTYDVYDQGPPTAPCLTTETHTGNDFGIDMTQNMWWSGDGEDGYGVSYPKNILVYIPPAIVWDYAGGWSAKFVYDGIHCSGGYSAVMCNGSYTGSASPPKELKSAWCNNNPMGTCSVVSGRYYYEWLFIRIAPDGKTRPVYGILINYQGGAIYEPEYYAVFDVYLHDKNNGWFNITNPGELKAHGGNYLLGSIIEFNKTAILRPKDGAWAWTNIDAILITYYPTSEERIEEGLPETPDPTLGETGYVNYIGLLTPKKAGDVPYCTNGTGPYNDIVDNGQQCYWGMNCDEGGSGWHSMGYSTGVGAFGECTCHQDECGKGYCEINIGSKKVCYHNVMCGKGGWRNQMAGFAPNSAVDICESDESCYSDGCVPT